MAHNAVADPQHQATPQTIGCGLKAREIDLWHNWADDPVMRDFIFDAADALADLILQNPQAYRPERLECARRVFGDPDDDGGKRCSVNGGHDRNLIVFRDFDLRDSVFGNGPKVWQVPEIGPQPENKTKRPHWNQSLTVEFCRLGKSGDQHAKHCAIAAVSPTELS
jgi:hypothetical protein